MEDNKNVSVFEQTEARKTEEATYVRKKKHFWQYSATFNVGLVMVIITLIVALLGVIVFNKVEKNFMDTV